MSIGTISSFQRGGYDVFYWKIDQFSTKCTKITGNNYYCSLDFYYKNHRSYLRFYPNGKSGKSGFVGLSLSSPDDKESMCAYLTLGLRTRSGRIQKWFSSYIVFPEENEIGSTTVMRQSEFLKRKEEFAPSDCLTFVVFLSTDRLKIIRGIEKVADDMGKLLASGDRSDAMVIVEEAEYKVHSCILSARTPVFAALFEHDTLEKATRKITITDCEPAIFKEFLNYIYTGIVQNLTAENAFGLYRVADKYLVKDLKKVCRDYIQDNLSTETFCEAVQLALKCGDNDLLESAFDYCAMNYKLIIRSVEWQRYIKENPIEANEVLIKSLGPP